jgi:outer membrane receptor protein involved in Fe transport
VGLSLNFQHPYHIGVTTFPFSLPGPGRPANRQNVGAYATADLNFGYNLPENWVSGASVNMTISNVLDSNPPYVDNANGSSGISPIGRLVEVGLLLKM